MKLSQRQWTRQNGWSESRGGLLDEKNAELVLIFGAGEALRDPRVMAEVRRNCPNAYLCGCSTAGEIEGQHVFDDSVVVTAIRFDGTTFSATDITVNDAAESFRAGQTLAGAIPHAGLVHAFVLSDGLNVNGSELVKGLTSILPGGVAVTGGLSGDGERFGETCVCVNGAVEQKKVVLLAFYGDRLRVGYGSMGGWDAFGLERRITQSKHNVLYELDGESALGLYKKYLGSHASELPASGLLFPLALRSERGEESVVRTCLAVNEQDQSITFAGDMPEGSRARFMQANFNRLIDGAAVAAQSCRATSVTEPADLAILISCVGRKMVLKQRIEEEVEAVRDVLGPATPTTGFYSYGEIGPFTPEARCALHNQTMTITTLTER